MTMTMTGAGMVIRRAKTRLHDVCSLGESEDEILKSTGESRLTPCTLAKIE